MNRRSILQSILIFFTACLFPWAKPKPVYGPSLPTGAWREWYKQQFYRRVIERCNAATALEYIEPYRLINIT